MSIWKNPNLTNLIIRCGGLVNTIVQVILKGSFKKVQIFRKINLIIIVGFIRFSFAPVKIALKVYDRRTNTKTLLSTHFGIIHTVLQQLILLLGALT